VELSDQIDQAQYYIFKGRVFMAGRTKRILMLISMGILLITIIVILFIPKDTNSSKELIKRAIEIAIVSGEIPDYGLIKDKKNIIISSENIDANSLPELLNIQLTVLSPAEIKEKANKEGDFLYIRFKEISINASSATISIDNTWAVQDNSKKAYLSGGGMTINFHKFLGKWKEDELRESWIS
jgi:hypothetical protein